MSEPRNQHVNDGWRNVPPDPDIFSAMIANHGFENIIAISIVDLDHIGALENNIIYGFLLCETYEEDSTEYEGSPPENMDIENQLPQLDQLMDVDNRLAHLVRNSNIENQDAQNIRIIPSNNVDVCATAALLSILANANVQVPNHIQDVLDLLTRGIFDIVHVTRFRNIQNHNYIANRSVYQHLKYHHIGYIYQNNAIWELDSLTGRPVIFANNVPPDWIYAMRDQIRDDMMDNRNRLIAIIRDPRCTREKEIMQRLMNSKLDFFKFGLRPQYLIINNEIHQEVPFTPLQGNVPVEASSSLENQENSQDTTTVALMEEDTDGDTLAGTAQQRRRRGRPLGSKKRIFKPTKEYNLRRRKDPNK